LVKLLLDENILRGVKEWLIEKGFEVTGVSQTLLKSCKDYDVAQYAASNGLVLLTLDQGFARIYRFFPKGSLTVIIVKAKIASSVNIIETLDIAQRKINFKDVQSYKGKLVIVSRNRIRIIGC
jgi:predicted nuclease of predicted toxin-antitoxin system